MFLKVSPSSNFSEFCHRQRSSCFVLCSMFTVWRDSRCHVCACVGACHSQRYGHLNLTAVKTSLFLFSYIFLAFPFLCFPIPISYFPFVFLSPLTVCVEFLPAMPDCLPACQAADKHFPWICHSHLASIWFFSNEVIGSGGKH